MKTQPKNPRPQPVEAAALPDALLRVATVAAVTGLSENTI